MQWKAFEHGGTTYDLTHLHSHEIQYEVPAADTKPPVRYTVDLTYSLHCFSTGLPKGSTPHDKTLEYSDARETRLFDKERYKLSKQLPPIIEGLLQRYCMHTGHGNFFTVALVPMDGQTVDYDVFFTASKSTQRGRVNLFVNSAFVREAEKLTAGKPIRFAIILYNTLHKKQIRA